MGDGRAPGAADKSRQRRRRWRWEGVEELEAGNAEGSGVVLEDAGGAEAAEDGAMADMVERPGVPGVAAVATTTGGAGRRWWIQPQRRCRHLRRHGCRGIGRSRGSGPRETLENPRWTNSVSEFEISAIRLRNRGKEAGSGASEKILEKIGGRIWGKFVEIWESFSLASFPSRKRWSF